MKINILRCKLITCTFFLRNIQFLFDFCKKIGAYYNAPDKNYILLILSFIAPSAIKDRGIIRKKFEDVVFYYNYLTITADFASITMLCLSCSHTLRASLNVSALISSRTLYIPIIL